VVTSPTFADGGPHTIAMNSGAGPSGLAGDCAACHRAHTAQAAYLLKSAVPGLCLSCHNGTGATTDVVDGYQFVPSSWTGKPPTDPVLGALRGGGFEFALIDSGNAARLITDSAPVNPGRVLAKVRVLAVASKRAVTSTHGGSGTVWGNGTDGTTGVGAGPVTLTCIACHNPHGNGQYRILNVLPGQDWTSATVPIPRWSPPTNAVEVQDTANPTNAVRNYTVLPGALASDVAALYGPTQGDYWRLQSPWNLHTGARDPMQVGWTGVTSTNTAANGGVAPNNFTGLMTAWCVSCHTRYSGLVNADGQSSSLAPQPDATFTYRHLTMSYGCEQCHVSHGSDAQMTTLASSTMTNPGGAAAPARDSRLLKVDNRGTCQLCHDPTKTAGAGYSGPTPTPGIP
jgi:predicted CXXCH cytochrome family protein